MRQNAENRETVMKRRAKRRRKCIFFLILCCVLSFFCGKMVGQAEKLLSRGSEQQTGRTVEDTKENMGETAAELPYGEPEETARGADDTTMADTEGQAVANLLLVNRDNPLPADYRPDLVTMQDGVKKCAREAYGSLHDMLVAGINEGLTFKICSAYRSVERQKELFDEDVNALTARGWSYEKACEKVAKETMPPGCSEHNTGLALDIVSFDYQVLDEKQENTAENIWLREHCAEYGFILRYPKGTEEITGIAYESWHFRYVGMEAAQYIMEHGLTLEEYLQQ